MWYLQDFCRAPRGSRQNLTHKCCSYLFPFCVVFAGLLQGARGIPANFDSQMLFLPSAVLCGICRTFAGRQGIPANFDPQMLFLPSAVLRGVCRTFAARLDLAKFCRAVCGQNLAKSGCSSYAMRNALPPMPRPRGASL